MRGERAALAVAVMSVALAARADDARDPTPAAATALAHQLDDETAAVDRAQGTLTDKLAAAEAARLHRLRAAYRLIRAAPGDAMATARVRAAVQLLVQRDGVERTLLTDEAAQLRGAREQITTAAAQLPSITLPAALTRPVPGKIVRRYGAFEHERTSGEAARTKHPAVMLSRRGVDIEVELGDPVVAPAAGIVRYAGPIRGLNRGAILDHGTYYTVLARLGEITPPVGAPIAAGDRIGLSARHRVYFEVRVKLGPGGLPIDPEPLLATTHVTSRAR